jgi:hypothetical protein
MHEGGVQSMAIDVRRSVNKLISTLVLQISQMGDSNMTPKAAHKEFFSLKTICAALNIVLVSCNTKTGDYQQLAWTTCR